MAYSQFDQFLQEATCYEQGSDSTPDPDSLYATTPAGAGCPAPARGLSAPSGPRRVIASFQDRPCT